MASGTIPVLDRSVRIRIRPQQLLHIREFLLFIFILHGLVVALQTDIDSVSGEQSAFLRRMRIVTVHTGRIFRDRGMLDRRCLKISDGFLVTISAKLGNCGRQHVLLLGHMRGMAIRASSRSGLMPEARI